MTLSARDERKILQMLHEVTAIPVDEIKPEHTLGGDLGLDSVGSLELIGMLDDAFGIELDLEDSQRITDVAGVLALAAERLPDARA